VTVRDDDDGAGRRHHARRNLGCAAPRATRSMPRVTEPFIPGIELSTRYYHDAVAPLLREHFDGLPHSAARVGAGSEVLGFDTERSADHDWGPRLQLFLRPDDALAHGARIDAMLAERLPKTFLGYPTHFAGDGPIRYMELTDGPVAHRVDIVEVGTWFVGQLGFDPREPLTTLDWLATPTQALAEATAGVVIHDGLGELEPVRARLAWYPDDVWRYLLACQWQRLSQEEAFVGRAGEVGDELGSAVVAARLVRDLMRLALLQHRCYPPYSKWLGSAFDRLPIAAELSPLLTATLAATGWRDRERPLARAYELVAAAQNELGLTDPLDPTTRSYHGRPFQVLHAERFAAALRAGLEASELRALPPIGAVDQYADSTDLLGRRELCRAVARATLDASVA
jgi:hypothetical protein